MSKFMTGYCWSCAKTTKHKVIEPKDSKGWRIFEGIITLGFSELTFHDYSCECCDCGKINTIRKE